MHLSPVLFSRGLLWFIFNFCRCLWSPSLYITTPLSPEFLSAPPTSFFVTLRGQIQTIAPQGKETGTPQRTMANHPWHVPLSVHSLLSRWVKHTLPWANKAKASNDELKQVRNTDSDKRKGGEGVGRGGRRGHKNIHTYTLTASAFSILSKKH
jgi:hypothetical protein